MLNFGRVGSLAGIVSDPRYRSYMEDYADLERRGQKAEAPKPAPQQKPAPAMSPMPRYAREQQVRNRLNPVGATVAKVKSKAAKAKSASPKDRKAKEREARKLKAQQYAEDRAQRRKIIQDKVRVIPRQTGTQRNRNRVRMAHLPSDDLHRNRRLQSRMQMMQALGFA